MQTPYRKPGKYAVKKYDKNLTQEKYDELKSKLEHIIKVSRPRTIKEMRIAAENGDFSENAEYQNAKSRLRGLNRAIDDIEEQLKDVTIIKASTDTDSIQLGHTVTISVNDKEATFQILGSAETDPGKGVISHSSPLGSALLGHKIGDLVKVTINGRQIEYKIISIK